ncbi:MAG TPA: excinuclease ABC subunit UvrA [Chitinophagales bacterium]|nr:excinuclease ABC subunit UvrA [Chitinophagales bacterium]HNI53402.1 excinuclease ABC subunit UvrA [Chitinophagales bacterium]
MKTKKSYPNGHIDAIFIKGAREHNLKNIDVAIPRNRLVVVTGVSGSGKSSLTFDTLYAEGQRRYVESLSAYARQFLNRLDKPDVDYIKGIAPAIALDQKVTTRTTRSTVGTLTEIYDYMRLLYARVGRTYSPISGREVKKDEVNDVVDYICSLPENSRIYLLVKLHVDKDRPLNDQARVLQQKGFTRFYANGSIVKIEDILEDPKLIAPKTPVHLLIDRVVLAKERAEGSNVPEVNEETRQRIADSVDIAFSEGHGACHVVAEGIEERSFSNNFEADGMQFEVPSPHFFNQNNPYGACKRCEGFGNVIGIDHDLVIPDKNLSVYQGAVACWKGEKMRTWLDDLLKAAKKFDFPIHKPISQLTKAQYQLLWTGNEHFWGLDRFFKMLEENAYKIQYRVMLARYRGKTTCPECNGSRIRPDADYVLINNMSITKLVDMQVEDLAVFINDITLNAYETKVASRILLEIRNRIVYMLDLGLGYLTLNRRSNTLSGGETQRINLTRTLGSNLTSSLYILDEPSVGLHPRDTERLVTVLKRLRNLGNTVVVVEHEEDVIRNADHIIDIGPAAGIHGGKVVSEGNLEEILADKESLTGNYLSSTMQIPLPRTRRKSFKKLRIRQASMHNLKQIDVTIPLQNLVAVSGVSGSGKTTLIKHILYPELMKMLDDASDTAFISRVIEGDVSAITQVELVDQDPIGKSSRSNPVTYVKAYDEIRDLYARQPLAKMRGYKSGFFSFNVDGGRCEMCKGEGEIIVEMQFLADVHLVCEDCNGKRFKEEILEVQYKNKNISELLGLSVEEAIHFLQDEKDIVAKLQPLADVGLGYVKLGQSSSTLSGGEAQRVKLASFLGKGKSKEHILFIFDEPTTGLHFHDINKLMDAFNALIECGHSVLVIEHNLEVIKCADYMIDLGPEGGDKGGYLLYQGAPEGIVTVKESYTGQHLKNKLK